MLEIPLETFEGFIHNFEQPVVRKDALCHLRHHRNAHCDVEPVEQMLSL